MIIDGKNAILGRLGSYAARKALHGDSIDVVNSEYIIVSGKKNVILKKYKHKLERGMPTTGPFVFRREDMFVKRSIRGMLPYKQEKGLKAYKRIKCYIGVPEDFKNKKIEKVEKIDLNNSGILNYMTVKDLCKEMGRKE